MPTVSVWYYQLARGRSWSEDPTLHQPNYRTLAIQLRQSHSKQILKRERNSFEFEREFMKI